LSLGALAPLPRLRLRVQDPIASLADQNRMRRPRERDVSGAVAEHNLVDLETDQEVVAKLGSQEATHRHLHTHHTPPLFTGRGLSTDDHHGIARARAMACAASSPR